MDPSRSETKRRLYTDSEAARLKLLAELTSSGYSISSIANLATSELERLIESTARESLPIKFGRDNGQAKRGQELVLEVLAAASTFDHAKLELLLDEGIVLVGYSGLVEQILVPVLRQTGVLWETGGITVAHEHWLSHNIRDYLARATRPMAAPSGAPKLVVATPSGQIHELGAAIAASIARKVGWNVLYLGACVPPEEIASVMVSNNAQGLALSLTYPPDDPDIPVQLKRIRDLIPAESFIIVGGQAATSYRTGVSHINAHTVSDLGGFSKLLYDLRKDHLKSKEKPALAPADSQREA